MNLGATIKNIRQERGINQSVLASKCKITQTYLSLIENNIKEPNVSILKVLAKHLKVPLPILFFLSMESEDIEPAKREAYKYIEPSIKSLIGEFFISSND